MSLGQFFEKHRSQTKQPIGGLSFKNILQGNKTTAEPKKQVGTSPSPSIVELLNSILELTVENAEIDEHYATFESQEIICGFNWFLAKIYGVISLDID